MYKSYKDLENKILNYGDVLKFSVGGKQYNYKVSNNHLHNYCGFNNEIFRAIGVTAKELFCRLAYGYESGEADFPTCKEKDFDALTRVALKLFKEVEKEEHNLVKSQDDREVITWDNLREGDKLWKEAGDYSVVLAKLDKALLLGYPLKDSGNIQATVWFTRYEVEEKYLYSYTEPKTVVSMTLKEIEEKLGHKVKIIE